MMNAICEVIRDTFDATMKSYLESEEFLAESKSVNDKFSALRAELSEDQQVQLNELLDEIDNHKNLFILEAYERAFIQGIAFYQKFNM